MRSVWFTDQGREIRSGFQLKLKGGLSRPLHLGLGSLGPTKQTDKPLKPLRPPHTFRHIPSQHGDNPQTLQIITHTADGHK